jgi:CBS domain-containing membrane protein
MFTLDAVMTTELITLLPTANLAEARELMHKHKIHHLPVVDSILRDPDNSIQPADVAVKDIMVTDVATVDERASLRQAALFLEKHRIGCLPVVTEGMLKGIITETDFVAVAINLLEQLEESEPDDEFAETA